MFDKQVPIFNNLTVQNLIQNVVRKNEKRVDEPIKRLEELEKSFDEITKSNEPKAPTDKVKW